MRRILVCGELFFGTIIFNFNHDYISQFIISIIDKKARIILIIEAIKLLKKINRLKILTIYKVFETTLRERINRRAFRGDYRPNY